MAFLYFIDLITTTCLGNKTNLYMRKLVIYKIKTENLQQRIRKRKTLRYLILFLDFSILNGSLL